MGGGLTEEDVRQAVKELAVVGVIRQIAKRYASRASGTPRTHVSRIAPPCPSAVGSASAPASSCSERSDIVFEVLFTSWRKR